jgi:hypothetical protein
MYVAPEEADGTIGFCCDVRERPFHWEGGGYGFFSKKKFLIPNVAEKNNLILVEEKKSDSECLSYNLMLTSGRKKYSNSRVVRKKNSERNKKP